MSKRNTYLEEIDNRAKALERVRGATTEEILVSLILQQDKSGQNIDGAFRKIREVEASVTTMRHNTVTKKEVKLVYVVLIAIGALIGLFDKIKDVILGGGS